MALGLFFLVCAVLSARVLGHHPLGASHKGYALGIRDSFMIAHSFKGEQFGPAQKMHGATFTVDAEFRVSELAPKLNWVKDIGVASKMLADVLDKYNLSNLDDIFSENTTTEFMCKVIFDELAAKCGKEFIGSISVKLWESHKAWASYEGEVGEHEGASGDDKICQS